MDKPKNASWSNISILKVWVQIRFQPILWKFYGTILLYNLQFIDGLRDSSEFASLLKMTTFHDVLLTPILMTMLNLSNLSTTLYRERLDKICCWLSIVVIQHNPAHYYWRFGILKVMCLLGDMNVDKQVHLTTSHDNLSLYRQILPSFSKDKLPWMKLLLAISIPRQRCQINSGRMPPHRHRSNLQNCLSGESYVFRFYSDSEACSS